MIHLNASKGLGDALYLRAVALHLLRRGELLTLYSKWPDAFADLAVTVLPRSECEGRDDLRNVLYSLSRDDPHGKSNFEAACEKAGIAEPVDLRLDWTVKNPDLIERITEQAAGRKIFVYQPLKFARNNEQRLLRPQREPYNRFIANHREHFRIRLGEPPYVDADRSAPCEMDLLGNSTIHDAFDIGTIGDLFFGESCFIPMLGEASGKRFAIMFTRQALKSDGRIRNVTPARLFHRKELGEAVYDESV